MMKGHIQRRGKKSWRIKFDAGRDETGVRKINYVTVTGTRENAEKELRGRLYQLDHGVSIDPIKITVSEYLDQWLADIAPQRVGPKALERYLGLVKHQIKPHLGATQLQKLRPAEVQSWHGKILKAVSARTVRHAHQVLRKALADAAATEIVERNVAALVKPPVASRPELEILTAEKITTSLKKLEGSDMHEIAVLAFASGMRRGELLALRWADLDLDAATVRVERSVEQTAAGLRYKAPKTAAGRRTISLPATAVDTLRTYRRQQLEQRLVLGAGRLPDDALVFALPDGTMRTPQAVSDAWRRVVKERGLPKVTFHALRHSHASALIAAGLDIVNVSRRLGHGSPAVTLAVYSHLFDNKDTTAATAIDGIMAAR